MHKKGFTFIEFLIVLAIMVLIIIIVWPFYMKKPRSNPELQKFKTPIWSQEDIRKQQRAGLTYQNTTMLKPPFYKGSMPLKFIAGKIFLGPSEMTNVYFDFGDFKANFIYKDISMMLIGIAEGAWVTDSSGRLVAEARVSNMVGGEGKQLQGVEIEEFHYGRNGKLIFTCKSEIDFPQGFKQKESEQIGKKENEYFFIWPVTNF